MDFNFVLPFSLYSFMKTVFSRYLRKKDKHAMTPECTDDPLMISQGPRNSSHQIGSDPVFTVNKVSLGLKKKCAFASKHELSSDRAPAGNRFLFFIFLLPWCVILSFEIVAIRTNYLKSGAGKDFTVIVGIFQFSLTIGTFP